MTFTLNGQTKSLIEGVIVAAVTASATGFIQVLQSGSVDYQPAIVLGLIAGLGALTTGLRGLGRYPDGSPIYAAPQGSVVVPPVVQMTAATTGGSILHLVPPPAPDGPASAIVKQPR